VRIPGTLIGSAIVVLLAWIIATTPVSSENRHAVDIGVTGRANAHVSIVSSGSNTTIFSLIYAILLRPFPYAEPARLVRARSELSHRSDNAREASVSDFQDWRGQSRSFDEIAAYWSFVNTLSGEGQAQSVLMTFATPELGLLYGVSATDPWTLAAVSAMLAVVALLACGIPVRGAMRVDPAVTSRAG
jgi:hypothetical protein